VERMAKYTIELLTNQKRYDILSKNARKRAEEFSEDNIVPMYEKFYEKIAGS